MPTPSKPHPSFAAEPEGWDDYDKICPDCGGTTTEDHETSKANGWTDDVEYCTYCDWSGSRVVCRFNYPDGSTFDRWGR